MHALKSDAEIDICSGVPGGPLPQQQPPANFAAHCLSSGHLFSNNSITPDSVPLLSLAAIVNCVFSLSRTGRVYLHRIVFAL